MKKVVFLLLIPFLFACVSQNKFNELQHNFNSLSYDYYKTNKETNESIKGINFEILQFETQVKQSQYDVSQLNSIFKHQFYSWCWSYMDSIYLSRLSKMESLTLQIHYDLQKEYRQDFKKDLYHYFIISLPAKTQQEFELMEKESDIITNKYFKE
jgi:hypothetical protein